jgi:two-component system sensor histidine kinase UhpB
MIGSFGINQDITERKKMESALINSRQMLMEAENLGGLGSWQWDRESGNLLWSDEMFQIWEIEKGKAPKKLEDFLNFIHIDDRETSINLTTNAFEENDTVEFQYRIIDGAGNLKYIQARTKAEKNENNEITHLLGVVQDVTKWVETNSDLEKSRTILRNLTDHLQQLREDEKKNIARELHDELGQMLTALKIDMRNILTEDSNLIETRTQLEEQVKSIDNIITTTRSLIQQLRPAILDDLGLPAAVEWLVSELRKRTEIKVDLRISPLELELNENMKVGLYRSIQETLNNVIKHSRASTVEISITKSDYFVVVDVSDNGIGFEPEKVSTESSMGLLGLKERIWIMGGTVEIKSKKNVGSSIQIKVPITGGD